MGHQRKTKIFLGRGVVLLLVLLLGSPTALAQGDRVVGVQEAEDIQPLTRAFSIPATQNIIAMAQDRTIWVGRSGQVARVQTLFLASVQLGVLNEFDRRLEESNVNGGTDHGAGEFSFFATAVELVGREIAGKTGSVGDSDKSAFAAYTNVVRTSMVGVNKILAVNGTSEEEAEITAVFATELATSYEAIREETLSAQAITEERQNFIPGRYVEGVRVAGHASTTVTTAKTEETLERVRQVFQGEAVRTEEVRRATEVIRTYNEVSQTISATVVTAIRQEYEAALQSAEAIAAEVVREIREFVQAVPRTEICDNQLDDDGDGAIDCQDSDCADTRICCINCP